LTPNQNSSGLIIYLPERSIQTSKSFTSLKAILSFLFKLDKRLWIYDKGGVTLSIYLNLLNYIFDAICKTFASIFRFIVFYGAPIYRKSKSSDCYSTGMKIQEFLKIAKNYYRLINND
jgi:hypothetical protein